MSSNIEVHIRARVQWLEATFWFETPDTSDRNESKWLIGFHRDWVKKNGTDIFKYSKNDAISFYITNIGFVGWNNVYRTSTNEFYLYFCMHNHEIEHFVRCHNVTDFDFLFSI